MDSTICALEISKILQSTIESSADSAVIWARIIWWTLIWHTFLETSIDDVKPLSDSHAMLLQESNVIFDFLIFHMDSTICALEISKILQSSIESSANSAVIWLRIIWWTLIWHTFLETSIDDVKPLRDSHAMLLQEYDVIFDFFVFRMDAAICALEIAEFFNSCSKSTASFTV